MRTTMLFCVALLTLSRPAMAQDNTPQQSPSVTPEAQAEQKKIAEARAVTERALARQRVTDRRNNMLWERWTYAVCIGCGWVPRHLRVVHTYPLRVLAGIPAADDDVRERSGRLPI
jgi:hypothetical protein